MDLSSRLLEQFLVVAEERHFGRAAERLSMRQPPLSQAIQRLERRVGVQLLDRGPGGVRLTPAGEAFATDAARLLAAETAALDRARRVGKGLEGDLSLGYVSLLSLRYLPRLLGAAARELPGLRIRLHQDSSAVVADMVRAGSLDLGFVRDPSTVPAELVTSVFARERVMAALPTGHPLAHVEALDLADLRDEPFVLPTESALPALRGQIHRVCEAAGFTPTVLASADDLTGLLSYVASGLCVSLLTEALLDLPVPGITYVPLRGAPGRLKSTVTAVHRPDPDPAVRRVLELATGLYGGG
ncbi:DNA-binding transcriptional LysR family regulator [Streptomyces sp. BK022]|uniref:LysR substrate-binding domain-containing protein n=1 Tax=Streptomyces sp. BK022 TaxID=2512123 RepID=UPI0010290938|nr:LysR substrate-binding domain-containing protein [Streptomyces sp. BK022]RZU30231.1 DNA-binding transcriptional LysR family regulator [Streptomyces sp. BK022]